MPWFRVDDNFGMHAKTVQAGNAAIGLWARAGSWSAQQLTDGFVPDNIANTFGTRAQAKALVDCGLWGREPGGYRFWQWETRQPSREQVEADRQASKERMARIRSKSVRPNAPRSSPHVRDALPDPSLPNPKALGLL